MKKTIFFAVLVTILFVYSADSFAQYKEGKSTLGILAGYGGGGLTGTGAIPIGLEFNFMNLGDKMQLGVFAAYASTSEEYNFFLAKGEWTYTNIIVALQGNYHFSPGEKFDPFIGVALGYNVASAKFEWSGTTTLASPTASVGGFFYSGQAGFNYWFSESMAAQVRVGYFPYVGAGLTFGL